MPSSSTKVDFDGFRERVLRRTQSQNTIDVYMRGVTKLAQFGRARLGLEGDDECVLQVILDDLSTRDWRDDAVYVMLDRFVGWALGLKDARGDACPRLKGEPIMPRTVHRHVEGIKKFLRYQGVDISNDKFREKVTLPIAEETPDIAIERETIRKILLSPMPLWVRAATAMMKDAGTRIGETLQVRVGDLHLEENPIRVSIRKETTKATKHGRISREVFVTDESADFFRQLIEQRKLGTTNSLFYRGNASRNGPDEYRMILYRWLPKLGLGDKIPGHKYHKVHAHIFRKFFFSAVVKPMGETAAHALMGHQFYLKTYYKRPIEEIRTDYRKAMPNLLVMRAPDEQEIKKKHAFDLLRELGLDDEGIKAAERSMGRTETSEITPELLEEIKCRLAQAWGYDRRDSRPPERSAGVF
ncbi:MAG TPA: site-specific integrase [Candidatus Bathyarchaeia archaeon]|nr:site-specific integrase [Candidatus Bathyarchaeia archaeon]